MSSARTVMVSVAAGLTGRDGASPRRSRIARQHRRAQLVQTQLLSLGLLSLGLLSLGLPSHRSCSRLASPGTAVPLAQPCNTPPTVCRVTQEGGNTIFSLSAIKVVPRKRQMLFFGYKLRGAAAWPKLVVPSIEKAQTCRPGQRQSGPPTARGALPLAHGSPLDPRAELGLLVPRVAALEHLRCAATTLVPPPLTIQAAGPRTQWTAASASTRAARSVAAPRWC